MRGTSGVVRPVLVLCIAATVVACKGRGAGDGASAGGTPADTGAVGGLTPEEIRARAQPMSPAKAESLGIVDTTIHVESQDSADLIPPRAAPAPVTPPPGEVQEQKKAPGERQ